MYADIESLQLWHTFSCIFLSGLIEPWLFIPNLKMQTLCCFKRYLLRAFHKSIIKKCQFIVTFWLRNIFSSFCWWMSLRDELWLILLWQIQMWTCQTEVRKESQRHTLPSCVWWRSHWQRSWVRRCIQPQQPLCHDLVSASVAKFRHFFISWTHSTENNWTPLHLLHH